MYKIEKNITLVTTASPLNQNLALLETDTIACIHAGFVNVIPVANPNRRCRYVSIHNGKGSVKQVKWMNFGDEILFVVASSAGLLVYDVGVYDLRFSHTCKKFDSVPDYTNGLCVVEDNILCVGTNLGTIFLFQYTEKRNFSPLYYFDAHGEEITLLDGNGRYLLSSSSNATRLWAKQDNNLFEILHQIYVEGLFSTPTVLKMISCLTFIGYGSGEFCVFDVRDSNFLVRTVAHKLKISGIDFCALRQIILTVSEDSYIKLWLFRRDKSEATCLFSVASEDGPLCGVGFLNNIGTQFCVASDNCVNIRVYNQNKS
ncbi:hypothetical protein FQR65_LT09843 [Abscondita terminalis]|nr:hypothetical protein FQR65_LT09843 [Abscondita terminalis]